MFSKPTHPRWRAEHSDILNITCAQMQILFALVIAFIGDIGFQSLLSSGWARIFASGTIAAEIYLFFLLGAIGKAYLWIFLYNLRRAIIHIFNIEEEKCTTCFVVFFCMPCSTAQMARHVLRYDTDGGPGCCDPGPNAETKEQTASLNETEKEV